MVSIGMKECGKYIPTLRCVKTEKEKRVYEKKMKTTNPNINKMFQTDKQ